MMVLDSSGTVGPNGFNKGKKQFRLHIFSFFIQYLPEMGLIETFIPRVVVPDPGEGGSHSETTYRVQVFA